MPGDTEDPPKTSFPPYPTPTFWPDPWNPEEPSSTAGPDDPEGTEQPSKTGSPTAVETPEVSFEISDPLEPPESEAPESPVETPVPSETSEVEEPVTTGTETEIEEPIETNTSEEPEEPVETETPEPPETVECTVVDEDETYDYIVIGAGAGGIPVAERLTAAGHKVLLLEKGPPSTARWGGDMKPEWLEGEDLTRFDVPGLCNQIWHDSTGIVCTDMDQIAGCVLGGGTAVNAGLWWKVCLSPFILPHKYGF